MSSTIKHCSGVENPAYYEHLFSCCAPSSEFDMYATGHPSYEKMFESGDKKANEQKPLTFTNEHYDKNAGYFLKQEEPAFITRQDPPFRFLKKKNGERVLQCTVKVQSSNFGFNMGMEWVDVPEVEE